jgi:NitT/TauT family transport system substrate-binding protein
MGSGYATRWGAALLAGGSLVLAGCSSDASHSASADGTVRIIMNNTNDALDVVVAEQQGFFTRHGVKVSTKTTNDVSQVPSLLGSQYDIGFSVSPILIRAAAAGVPVVAVSGNDGDFPGDPSVEIIVRKGITRVDQLKGKRIGSPTLTGNLNVATKAWLAQHGVDPKQEQYLQVATPNMLDQIKAGQLDAVQLIPPFVSLAKKAGFKSLGDPDKALTKKSLGGTYWIANSSWAEKHPDKVRAFRAALDDASRWVKDNQAKAYQVSADYTKVDPKLAKLSPLGPFTTDVKVADLKIWGEAMRKYGDFYNTVDYAGLVRTTAK